MLHKIVQEDYILHKIVQKGLFIGENNLKYNKKTFLKMFLITFKKVNIIIRMKWIKTINKINNKIKVYKTLMINQNNITQNQVFKIN